MSATSQLTQEWQALTGGHVFTYPAAPSVPGSDLAWSPDGKYLAIATFVKSGQVGVQLWNAVTHQLVVTYPSAFVYTIAWSPDSQQMALGTSTTSIVVWNIATRDTFPIIPVSSGRANEVAWSPDGKELVAAINDGSIHVWNAKTGKARITTDHQGGVLNMRAVAWSPDGKYLASGSEIGIVFLWDAITARPLHMYTGHSAAVTSVVWSPDSTRIVSGSEDHSVYIWKVG